MSCYGWERGEVTIPAGEFTKFKKNFIERLTLRQEKLLNIANSLHAKIKEKKLKEHEYVGFMYGQLKYEKLSQHEEQVIRETLVKDKKLIKPKKQDFKVDKTKMCFYDTDLTVSIDVKNRVVVYRTDDNNHSVDEARETFLGKTVLNMLENVKYTTHTGGYLRSQNEYDVDAGFGAKVTATFGKYSKPKYLKSLCNC